MESVRRDEETVSSRERVVEVGPDNSSDDFVTEWTTPLVCEWKIPKCRHEIFHLGCVPGSVVEEGGV
jgi:hypothetical protein